MNLARKRLDRCGCFMTDLIYHQAILTTALLALGAAVLAAKGISAEPLRKESLATVPAFLRPEMILPWSFAIRRLSAPHRAILLEIALRDKFLWAGPADPLLGYELGLGSERSERSTAMSVPERVLSTRGREATVNLPRAGRQKRFAASGALPSFESVKGMAAAIGRCVRARPGMESCLRSVRVEGQRAVLAFTGEPHFRRLRANALAMLYSASKICTAIGMAEPHKRLANGGFSGFAIN